MYSLEIIVLSSHQLCSVMYNHMFQVYTKSSYNPKNPTSDIIQPDSSASTSIGSSLKHSLEDLLQSTIYMCTSLYSIFTCRVDCAYRWGCGSSCVTRRKNQKYIQYDRWIEPENMAADFTTWSELWPFHGPRHLPSTVHELLTVIHMFKSVTYMWLNLCNQDISDSYIIKGRSFKVVLGHLMRVRFTPLSFVILVVL